MAKKVETRQATGPSLLVLMMEAVALTWKGFAKETSVHGLKYVTSGRIIDRIAWSLMVVLCATMAGVLVAILSFRYLSNPTRTVYKTQHEPITTMHFPAVSLCAPRKITHHRIDTLLNKLKIPGELEEQRVSEALPQLLGFVYPINVDVETLKMLDTVLLYNDLDTETVMSDLAPPCGDVVVRCRWAGRDVPCGTLFKRSKTFVGFCCTFNYNSNVKGVAFEAFGTQYIGPDMGLSFVVDTYIEEFSQQVYHKMDSFKVLIHGAETYASRYSDEIVLAQRKQIFLACVVQSLVLGQQAAQLAPGARRCLMPSEQTLRYFQAYSKDNCLLECEMQECMKMCSCLPFLYPRLPGEALCNASSIPCVIRHFQSVRAEDWASSCSCPRQCNQNSTTIDVHSAHLRAFDLTPDIFYSRTSQNQSIVHVYHSKQVATVIKRTIYSHWVDLISSFGGMFNLFLGCSFVSILELFYFLLVKFPRHYITIYRRSRQPIKSRTVTVQR